MRGVLFAAALLCCAGFAAAQETFPSRPLTIVVPTGPSGQTDVFARLIAEQLRQRLSQPVVVDNKPGAGGSLAGATSPAGPPTAIR
jgi:tripartite-type tricarboxylate transporter receptor subunit TctC